MPYNLDIRPVYYRKDLLEAKGIKPPTNWAEFQAAAIALNDPASGNFGVVFPAGNFHITQHFYMSFMFQAGGSILDKDGNLVFGTTAKNANVKALIYLTDFATKHKVTPPGIASYNTDDAHTIFVQGRAAFGFGTGEVIRRVMKEN
ncbi:MAG: extracellular solute-binding protein, partial [Burkholderiales bacterium]|nr:extracellular solute-binding protein [Burkholderiales bacterium]